MPSSPLPDDPSFITREVYDETRYTPETRRIMDENDRRRAADEPPTILFSAGDWDFGSATLAEEVAGLGPGLYDGDIRHIDEVANEETLIRIHVYTWDGSTWKAQDA